MKFIRQPFLWVTDRISAVQSAHPRSRRALQNSIASVLVKIGNVSLSFVLVRLTLELLKEEKYGIWTAISSLVTFASFFDIGLGNGLRNRLSEAVAKGDPTTGRAYVSTAYLLFTVIQFGFLALAASFVYFVDWRYLLNVRLSNSYMSLLILITLSGFCIKLMLDAVSSVLMALQKTALSNLIYLVVNAGLVLGIWALALGGYHNLLSVSIITAIVPVVVILGFSIYYYRTQLRDYAPSFKYIDFSTRPMLMNLGLKFFIIQIAGVVIFSTDNVIISKLFGPAIVTEYSVVFRYYNAVSSLFMVIISPFWSAFTEAYAKNDMAWVQSAYKRMQRSWLLIFGAVVILYLLSGYVYKLWLGDSFKTSWSLNAMMAVFVLIACWNNITVTVLNGFGKVKLQLFTAVAGAIINLPLCVYFGRNMGFGSKGIIMASSISLLFGTVLGTIQADKLISRKATGIWAK